MNREKVLEILEEIFYLPIAAIVRAIWYRLVVAIGKAIFAFFMFVYGVIGIAIFVAIWLFYWAVLFIIFSLVLDYVDGPHYDRLLLWIAMPLGFYASWIAVDAIHGRLPARPLYRNIVDAASELRPTSYSSKRAKIRKRRRF